MAGPFRVPGTCLVGPVGRTLAGKGGAQLLHASSPPPPADFRKLAAHSQAQLPPAGAPLLGSLDLPSQVWSTM